MINFFKKFYKKNKSHLSIQNAFEDIKNKSEIGKLFSCISDFSEKSEIRYVGGCVRKILNSEKIDDIDLAVNLNPNQVQDLLKNNKIKFFDVGIDHGTITAKINENFFEITSLRKDISTDGRHAKVEYTDNWHEDASRRDFTMNAIYSDISGNLYDPFNGKKDLQEGEVKFIGNPEDRIKEDYLRILRYIRFFSIYSKKEHDPNLKKIIRKNLSGISKISSERLLGELKKIVISDGFLKLVNDEFSLEIINLIFPQLKNINLFKNLNEYSLKIFKSKDFIFLISLMIIDETDNSEYFLYKYNISNENKKRIRQIKEFFSKPITKESFSKNNIKRILYFYNKNYFKDLINFYVFKSRKINKKIISTGEYFNDQPVPILPINAKKLINEYKIKEGKEIGEKLKKIEDIWIKNNFEISKKEIENVVNN